MRKYVIATAVAAVATMGAVPSNAAVNTIVAVPGSGVAGYATPRAVINRAAPATFVNLDAVTSPHDVTSVEETSGTPPEPKIYTAVIDGGETATIMFRGTLTAGDYEYYCSIHQNMRGTITLQ